MIETKHDLLTTKYTKVLEEAEYKYNAPHTFKVVKAAEENSEEPTWAKFLQLIRKEAK